jgi:hypothetical protein
VLPGVFGRALSVLVAPFTGRDRFSDMIPITN